VSICCRKQLITGALKQGTLGDAYKKKQIWPKGGEKKGGDQRAMTQRTEGELTKVNGVPSGGNKGDTKTKNLRKR